MSAYVSAHLRSLVQRRACQRCEYCLLHEEGAFAPHEPDHVIARKHGGETDEDNLAWACMECNRLKGSDLASVDIETGRIVRLFNPRRDRWQVHFRLRGARILPLTSVGRVTEYLLQFNRPDQVAIRKILIQAGTYPG